MPQDSVLQVSVSAGVATLTLDSPANRNALSRAMRAQLRDALLAALADDAVRVVVLDHTGRVFCSGMDLSEAAGGGAQEQGVREFPELLQAIWSSPKPVVAVVRGPARAGGVGLLAACDVVVAASSATFAFSEVRLGIVPAVISAVVLPRMVPHVAHRLMLTGEVFDAAARRRGRPDRRRRAGRRRRHRAGRSAHRARRRSPGRAGRDQAAAARADAGPRRSTPLLELSARYFASEEGQEGIAAFREKRPGALGAAMSSGRASGLSWCR